MIELKGTYNTAKVFTDTAEDQAIQQIKNLLNQEFIKDSQIRIMPDTHAGAGCTIGTTMTITDKIVPNLVGVDIGCGMETVKLKEREIPLSDFDKVIHKYIPAGFATRETAHPFMDRIPLEQLHCFDAINYDRAVLSMGTLGGGNHFIEIDKDTQGNLYLVIHSGSRHLGKAIAEYYQREAIKQIKYNKDEMQTLIKTLKAEGRYDEIQRELKRIKLPVVDKKLAYVEGKLYEEYLHDMALAQNYAKQNRKAMVQVILEKMNLTALESFTTIHNYIDIDSMILRKGAISAKWGEISLIPINMRDGSLICKGKGNADWNYSAPHGAGRLMSRTKAKEKITLSQFKESMKGIYSSTIGESTIDEAAFAYKPMEEIIKNVGDTVEILNIIKPIYNFKAAEY